MFKSQRFRCSNHSRKHPGLVRFLISHLTVAIVFLSIYSPQNAAAQQQEQVQIPSLKPVRSFLDEYLGDNDVPVSTSSWRLAGLMQTRENYEMSVPELYIELNNTETKPALCTFIKTRDGKYNPVFEFDLTGLRDQIYRLDLSQTNLAAHQDQIDRQEMAAVAVISDVCQPVMQVEQVILTSWKPIDQTQRTNVSLFLNVNANHRVTIDSKNSNIANFSCARLPLAVAYTVKCDVTLNTNCDGDLYAVRRRGLTLLSPIKIPFCQ